MHKARTVHSSAHVFTARTQDCASPIFKSQDAWGGSAVLLPLWLHGPCQLLGLVVFVVKVTP